MAEKEEKVVKKHRYLDLLHQQLLKDQYAVPEDYSIFEKTLKDPAIANAVHKQLIQDNYAIPEDYNEFLKAFGLKKKEAGDYGLPSTKVFEDMFAQVRKGKATEPQPEEGFPETASRPEVEESDLFATPKEKDKITGEDIFKSTLQFSIGNYLTKERFDNLKRPELSVKTPEYSGFKELPVGQKVIKEGIEEGLFNQKVNDRLSEIDKELAALPKEEQAVGTILPTVGPYISKPIVSEERAALLKEKDRLKMLQKAPSTLEYILGRAYNQTITGLSDAIINGEAKAPEEWLSKYDSNTLTDVTATVLGFLLDMPAFGLGGKIGTAITKKAAAPFVKRIMENSVKKMVKAGIPEKLAGEFALKAAGKTTMALQGMGSSSAALGSYSAVTNALGQWAVPEATFDDIKWSQVFKSGLESSVLGLGVGGLGIGASMLAQKASAIPSAIGRLGAKGAIGAGGLTAESALFTYGGAMLEGRKLKDVTKEDFLSTVAMLGMLKASHVVGKIPGAIEDPKKAAARFYKSVAYNPNKVGEGIFAVDLVPYEIESVGGKDYKSLVRKLANDDAYLGSILQNENIPARLKQKLLWASRGTAMEDVNLYGDKITQNGVYVDMTNKEGVLVERKKFGTPEEAESFAIRNQAQLNDMKIQEKAASLPIEEKTKIIEKLKEAGFDDALLVSALEKPVNERTPEENKLVAKYYSFIPKGDIKPEDVIKEEIPDVIVVEPGKGEQAVIEKPEEVIEKPETPKQPEVPSVPKKPAEPETPEQKAIRINDRIATLVKQYNDLPNSYTVQKQQIQSTIQRLMRESEKDKYNIVPQDNQKISVTKNGKKVSQTKRKGDNVKFADIPEGEFKDFLNTILKAKYYLSDLDVPLGPVMLNRAIEDIFKGKANQNTQFLIEGLEDMFNRGEFRFKGVEQPQPSEPITIKSVMDEIKNEKVIAFSKEVGDFLTVDNIDKAVEYGIIDKKDVERVKKILEDEITERKRIESEWAEEEGRIISELDKAGDAVSKDQGKTVPEEKPIKSEIKATPEQQVQIDKINKEYNEKIARRQAELDEIPGKIERALAEASKRTGLFGDTKPVEPDEIIKREEQGFTAEGAVERIRKPFEERTAELRKEIDALTKERESKIGEVLRQQDLFAAAPEKPSEVDVFQVTQYLSFEGKQTAKSTEDSIIKLNIDPNDPTRATFSIDISDNLMLRDVISNPDKYLSEFTSIDNLYTIGDTPIKGIRNIQQGKARLVGGKWQVTEKAAVELSETSGITEKAKTVTPKAEKELPELRSPEVKDYDSDEDVKLINQQLDRGNKVFKTFYRKKGEEKWRRAYLTSSPDLTEAKARESAKRQLLADASGIPIGRENEALSRYEFKAEEVLPEERKPEMPEVKPSKEQLQQEKKAIEKWLKEEGEEFISVDWDGEIVEIFKGRDEKVQEYTRGGTY